jgi:DHA1 family tetracycline resistance protein-like MFS transporter
MMRHPELTQLSVLTFFSNVAGFAIQTTWVLYVTYRYGWQPGMTGISLAVLGTCTAVAQMAVIGRFVKRFGERAALFSGLGFGALGMIGCGLAPSTGWFFVAIVPLCLWGLAPAAGQAMMTRRVTPREQGELQGAIGALRGVAALFAPAIFTTAFAAGIGRSLPGAAWYLGVLFLAVAVLPMLRELPTAPDGLATVGDARSST